MTMMTCKRFALIDFKGVEVTNREALIQLFLGTAREIGATVQTAGELTPDVVDPFEDLNEPEDP